MNKNSSKTILIRVFVGAAFVALMLLLYVFLLLNGVAFSRNVKLTPKANITVLAVDSIPTPDLGLLTITSTPTSAPSETIDGISTQKYVMIQGTGGVGLRIRNNPGTEAEVNFIANESEVFKVIGGPQTVNDMVWWQLVTPYDDNRKGWASAQYLVAVADE